MLGPKIRLSNKETVRAYAVWHSLKFEKKQIPFSQSKEKLNRGLS